MEEWQEICSFPGYSVSNTGFVRNDKADRLLTRLVNQSGTVYVGLNRDTIQHKRSVALLVADAFLQRPQDSSFDTPINLDGVRLNNDIENLVWRPRWFAVKYHQQFHNGSRGFVVPIQDVDTGEWFPNSWEAAVKYGLIDREILIATLNRTYVWPTYQKFSVV